jgi:hypothetical protein
VLNAARRVIAASGPMVRGFPLSGSPSGQMTLHRNRNFFHDQLSATATPEA